MFDLLLAPYLTGILLALMASILGSFIVWRKMSYFGDTISHSALFSVVFALHFNLNMSLINQIFAICLALTLFYLQKKQSLSLDTLLGILSHSLLAFAMVSLALIKNIKIDIQSYLFGDLLIVDWNDVYLSLIFCLIVVFFIVKYWKQLILSTIDKNLAATNHINIDFLDALLLILISCTIVLMMKIVGVLLITALLIIPSAGSIKHSKEPIQVIFISIIISLVAINAGFFLSYYQDLPTGPVIVCSATILCFISFLIPSKK